jgi:hypothetical protein
MQCPKCRSENGPGVKFCGQCGTPPLQHNQRRQQFNLPNENPFLSDGDGGSYCRHSPFSQ